jgi:uncharacterized protein (TIGR02452 family)
MATSERARLAAQAEEIFAILRDQIYETDDGTIVDLSETLARIDIETWQGEDVPRVNYGGRRSPRIVVTGETSLEAAWARQKENPLVLNFASATRPGGGWRSGAATQEESLCRASALYAALARWDVYALNTAKRDPLYATALQYAARVPLLRDLYGRLVSTVPAVAFVSCAAVNFSALWSRSPADLNVAYKTARARIEAVVATATTRAHRTLIAGAWGTGAFGGDADQMATWWREILLDSRGVPLDTVVFPVPDEWTRTVFASILLRA